MRLWDEIWLTPWAGKMNQILRCDWLPERARWSYLPRSGLPAVSRKKNFLESHIINLLLTKLVWSRWLDISLVLFFFFFACLWTSTPSRSMQEKPSWPHTWSIIHIYLRAYIFSKQYKLLPDTIKVSAIWQDGRPRTPRKNYKGKGRKKFH